MKNVKLVIKNMNEIVIAGAVATAIIATVGYDIVSSL